MKFSLQQFVAMPPTSAHGGAAAALYVIACPGFIKIGISGEAGMRLSELQIGNPHKLELVAGYCFESRAAAILAEACAHRFLAAHRAQGEWFAISATEAADVLDGIYRHADALTRLRDSACLRDDEAYGERYETDAQFRAMQDAAADKRRRRAKDRRLNRDWRMKRAA